LPPSTRPSAASRTPSSPPTSCSRSMTSSRQ
jgi:hypothetical protein